MFKSIKEILNVQDNNLNLFEETYSNKYLTDNALYELLRDSYNLNEEQEKSLNKILSLENKEEIEENGKITVMINTFNRLSELKQCINSILMQTYENYEIIIMDDNSTDGTEAYCKELLKDERIKYFKNNENKGQAYGKKEYFSKGNGKYIIFCDDDDYYIDKEFFTKAVKILESKSCINCVCANSLIKYEDKDKYVFEKLNFKNMISAYEYLENFQLKYLKPNSTFPVMFRRKTLLKNGILEMDMINDSSIYLRSFISNGRVYLLEDIVGIYRVHKSNVTKNLKLDFIFANMYEKKRIYEFLKEYAKEIKSEEWFEKQISFTIYYYLTNSKYSSKDLKKLKKWCIEYTGKNKLKVLFKIFKIQFKNKMKIG